MIDGRFYKDQLREVFGGRRWLLAVDAAAGATGLVRLLRELGAERPFVLGGFRGVGELPSEDEAELAILGVGGATMMGQIRASESGYRNPGGAIEARIQAWDPQSEARVLGTIFAAGGTVCGRSYYGARPASWQALEDKVVAESIWDGAGVTRVEARVCEARLEPLLRAASAVDGGVGTVWSGDMREGFNGGGEYVRWVRSETDGTDAAAFFEAHCDQVRVMPFLEGLPCSIHGMVLDGAVLAFRPCEMLVLRTPGSSRFRYASAATFWEPEDQPAEAMREVARAVGAHLIDRVGYRGAFTVDGVLTTDGFRPTELNPRIGAALMRLTGPIPDLSMILLNLAAVAEEPLDWRPAALEALVLRESRVARSGSSTVVIEHPCEVGKQAAVRIVGHRAVLAGEGAPDVHLSLGEHPAGGLLKVVLDPARTPPGPSVAPRVAAAIAWADEAWNLGIGALRPAPDLRGPPDR